MSIKESVPENSETMVDPQQESQLVELIKLIKKGQADRAYAELTNNFPEWIGKSTRSNTLLFKAVEMGFVTIVEIILQHCPTLLESKDARGNTPFLIAIEKGHLDLAMTLQNKGCCITETNYCSENALHKLSLIKLHKRDIPFVSSIITALTEKNQMRDDLNEQEKWSGRGIDIRNQTGETALHTAVKEDNVKLCELLIKAGADPTALNNDGISPIVYAEANDESCLKIFKESEQVKAAIKFAEENQEIQSRRIERGGSKIFTVMSSIDDSDDDSKDKDKKKIGFFQSKSEKYEIYIDKLLQENKPSKEYMLEQRAVGENKFRILSLDGCGVRTLVQLIILKRIVENFPHFLDNVDMICSVGASTLPILMTLVGYDIDTVIKIYEKTMVKVFSSTSHKGGVLSYKYSSKFIKILANKIFQDKKLCDLKREVVVPVIKIDSGINDPNRRMIPVLLNNIVLQKTNTDLDDNMINNEDLLSDVVLRSFATPGLFTCHQSFVDGSFLINQPFAVAKAFFDPKESVVLSLSGGTYKSYFDAEKYTGAGYVQWATCVTDLFKTAGIALADEFAKVLFGPRAHRLDPKLPCQIDDDSFKDIELLKTIAAKVDLSATEEWILQNW
ncbi:hypothetical protein ENUP19_0121G0171 [Entamoeba nuttalli]|uniref:phospholipase A2 n=2 Tax=Entamoeba nuttalli TaxID=412467 RepID=K2H8K9_ENTNP|nr:phospholipase, patatin family protein [Entamoeba nuttalli P19]EKE42947.1 phospholipase, patatin family protein [Entamoeba nuttalli P19]|eukprot:XP_008854719.1 phospholipase, patatin family protein [Entamoeba nuttalli P19]